MVTHDWKPIGNVGGWILKSDENIKVVFAHLDTIYVNIGDDLVKGNIIGEVGNTWTSIKNHLHYELIINDEPVNPIFAAFDKFTEIELRLIFTQNRMSMDWLIKFYCAQQPI